MIGPRAAVALTGVSATVAGIALGKGIEGALTGDAMRREYANGRNQTRQEWAASGAAAAGVLAAAAGGMGLSRLIIRGGGALGLAAPILAIGAGAGLVRGAGRMSHF